MINTQHQPLKSAWWEWLLLLTALAIFVTIVMTGSRQKSASFDEQNHLTAGYTYLKTGDPRLADAHPPLAAMLAASALLPRDDIVLPLEDPTWERGDRVLFADMFFWRSNTNQQEMLVAARVPIMLVGMLLLSGLWLWARQMAGRWAGLIALFLGMLDPNLIANSRVVTTDLVLTAFFFLAMWRYWHWVKQLASGPSKRPFWLNVVSVGILAGLTISTKYTGLLFWPVALICGLIFMTTFSPVTRRSVWKKGLLGFLSMGIISVLVLWAVYGFSVGVPADFPVQIPLPAPFFWQSLWRTFVKLPNEATAKLNFLLGEVSPGGWWYYFPVALAVKTPLPTLILSGVGMVAVWRNGRLRESVCAWLPPLAFLALGMTGKLTIGYRHILPALPFWILLGSIGGSWLIHLSGQKRAVHGFSWRRLPVVLLALLLIWFGIKTVRITPHQDAYFNTLAGDWTNWANILVDSNLDWGQDLIALRQLMHDYGLAEVNLAYFGLAMPEQYDINYKPLPGYWRLGGGKEVSAFNPYTPAPGWYAISATSLQLGLLSPETVDYYAAFQEMEPIGRAGYSIYLYHIPEEMYEAVNRVVVTGEPVGQQSAEALGVSESERTIAKWTRSDETMIFPLGEGFAADYVPVGANFEDVMLLLGYELEETVVTPQSTLPLTLYWQVGTQPMPAPAPSAGPPLSAFVHLTGEEVWQVAAQKDGWGTALRGLEPGDIIAQHLNLPIGDINTGEYTLLTGLYSPQTGERLVPKTAVADERFIRLQTLSVE